MSRKAHKYITVEEITQEVLDSLPPQMVEQYKAYDDVNIQMYVQRLILYERQRYWMEQFNEVMSEKVSSSNCT